LAGVPLQASSGSQSVDRGLPADEHPVQFTSPAIKEGLQAHISQRRISIQPGSLWVNDKHIHLRKEMAVYVPNCPLVAVKNEPVELTADSLKAVSSRHILQYSRASENDKAPIEGVIAPGSVRVKPTEGDGNYYKPKIDYALDLRWGALSRVPTGAIKEGQKVFVDYTYFTRRIDTLIVDEAGKMKLLTGKPSRSAPEPPVVDPHSLPLANIYAAHGAEPLKVQDFMPITARGPAIESTLRRESDRRALKVTLDKLSKGQPVRIVFWGDSITAGADASAPERSFAHVLLAELQQKYPRSHIQAFNAGIGGSNTKGRLKDFDKEVTAHRPDVIVVEFVNDIHLTREVIELNYRLIAEKARRTGAELLIVNPHWPAPQLLGVVDWSLVGKAPFYAVLRKLAGEHQVAFADVAKRWERLPREGLAPELVLVDKLVHPNNKGHALYAEEILKCFN
jgi:lysophospholipase L1-like esterase